VRPFVALPLLALLALARCNGGGADPGAPAPRPAPAPDPLAPLHAFEDARRATTDFAHLPASSHALGPDPYVIRALPAVSAPARYAGLLRGRDALVLLDGSLHEIARAAAPGSPSGLAVSPNGEILVAGEEAEAIRRYRADGGHLTEAGEIALPGALALRDVAVGPEKAIYAVEERRGRLFAIAEHGDRQEIAAGTGAFRVDRAGDRVIADSLLDHTLSLYPVDARGMPIEERVIRIHNDGPIWSFAAAERGGDLFVLAGGVEDHPLDRTGGSFGFIDSFVSLYRVQKGAAAAERLGSINVSAEGLITPKAMSLRAGDHGLTAIVAGYGADKLLTLTWGVDPAAPPSIAASTLVPGVSSIAPADGGGMVFADPLLDVWMKLAPGDKEPSIVPAEDPGGQARSPQSRLGEALFFTNLMAPWNQSLDRLSRFTCETCHFEGYADGRIHHTGRGDVHATTKPLLGLFNNRPHFSRALDPDLTTVANNEFRVAGALSGHDPWFTAPVADLPWAARIGAPPEDLGPEGLRRALMAFLMDFTHRPNPAAIGRTAFSDLERRGADAFAARCEGCHAARLASDVPGSRAPREQWEALIFSREGPLVWGIAEYKKTGIEPYVNEKGARVPSLRRLYKKRPYFTNGTAADLEGVLDRARFGPAGAFLHDKAPAEYQPLDAAEKQAIRAFLDLL
jgi:hypothetical protein